MPPLDKTLIRGIVGENPGGGVTSRNPPLQMVLTVSMDECKCCFRTIMCCPCEHLSRVVTRESKVLKVLDSLYSPC